MTTGAFSIVSPVVVRSLSSRAASTSQIDSRHFVMYLVCRSRMFARNARIKTINAEVAELMYSYQVLDQLQYLPNPIQMKMQTQNPNTVAIWPMKADSAVESRPNQFSAGSSEAKVVCCNS